MSGGRFDYKDSNLKHEIFGWCDKPSNVFEDKEISELVWDVLDLIHDFNWYTSEKNYLKAKKAFKDKWLTGDREVRIKEIVEETIEDAKAELYKTFGLE